MTFDQGVVFSVLALTLVMFVWGRFRYDLVALLALLVVVLTGVLPIEQAFTGFSHPAVITVAAVLMISRALQNAGIVDVVIRVLAPFKGRVTLQLMAQTLVVALRNAYREGYSPAKALMPLAFGSILGGMVTLIGTPPNIIISTFRAEALGEGFTMFAFAPVGGSVALLGVAFVALLGWRLIPAERVEAESREALFDVSDYLTELRVPEKSKLTGKRIFEVERLVDEDVVIVGLVRDGSRRLAPHGYESIRGGDVLVVEADPSALKEMISATDLELEEAREFSREDLGSDEVVIFEAIVGSTSTLRGRTPSKLQLPTRHGIKLLALDLANRLQVNADPMLMAVAIGASCAFLTPIGHQSNTLVFEPGGYRFGDYWRMGLPLEVLIVLISVPLILLVFPL